MADDAQQAPLTRMRRIATGLLLLMAALFVAAKLLQPRFAWLSFVAAFAEAAMVGALADWFAVTALFRHPMGLRIPHTAIIPRNKDRIGHSISNFLQHNFLTHEVLRSELAGIDFSGSAAAWLAQQAHSRALARQIVSAVPALLRGIEDEDAGRFLRGLLSGSLNSVRLAPLLGEVLTVLVAGRQHVVLLEKILAIVARALEENRPYIRQKVHENSPRWIPKSVDEKFFERLMDGVQSILRDIQEDDGVWRTRFQDAIDELIAKLASSSDYEASLHRLLSQGLNHPMLLEYVGQVWQDVRQRLLADAASADSQLVVKLDDALRVFGKALLSDRAVQGKLNDWLRTFAADAIVERRALIAAVVERVIGNWDADTITRKLELHVGKDLQYIRINGTLVGGLVGLLLHAVALLF